MAERAGGHDVKPARSGAFTLPQLMEQDGREMKAKKDMDVGIVIDTPEAAGRLINALEMAEQARKDREE